MKYDPKTGKKQPESRLDEVRISREELEKLAAKCEGAFDRRIEILWVLQNCDISLALIADFLGAIYKKLCDGIGINVNEEQKKEETPQQ